MFSAIIIGGVIFSHSSFTFPVFIINIQMGGLFSAATISWVFKVFFLDKDKSISMGQD